MAFFDWGNTPIHSSGAQPVTNPDTSTLLAELDSTQLGTMNYAAGQTTLFRVTWILGGDTNVLWVAERATSTALGATADSVPIFTPSKLSGQYMTTHKLGRNERLRARVFQAVTGTLSAFISAEPLT